MFKKYRLFIINIIFVFLISACNYFYMYNINKLEKSYNIFIMQQLLLLEKGDINSSQVLMSSYVNNALTSINRNNEFSNYNHICTDWNQLQIIISKYTKLDIENKHLSSNEKKIIKKQKDALKALNINIKNYCKNKLK